MHSKSLFSSSVVAAMLTLSACSVTVKNPQNIPIPITESLPAKNRGDIVLANGTLLLRPNKDRFLDCWGVDLKQSGRQVFVRFRASPRAVLKVDDQLLAYLWTPRPATREEAKAERFGKIKLWLNASQKPGIIQASDKTLQSFESEATAISSTAQLKRFNVVWGHLILLIKRQGKKYLIRQEISRPTPLAIDLWEPERLGVLGVRATRINQWPERHRPVGANSNDLLVLHVGNDSPLGAAGLRPFQLIELPPTPAVVVTKTGLGENKEKRPYAFSTWLRQGEIKARKVNGRTIRIKIDKDKLEPFSMTNMPFVLTTISKPSLRRVDLGPLGMITHTETRQAYSPRTRQFETAKTRIWFSLISRTRVSNQGQTEASYFKINAGQIRKGALDGDDE